MSPPSSDRLLKDADLCVKCGLCLPHCPTYVQQGHEGASPRGRITLIQALASGAMPLTPAAQAHLDGCLSCRSCEAVCPAKVPFGRLMDNARGRLAAQRPSRRLITGLLASLLSNRRSRAVLVALARLYRWLPLPIWLRTSLFGRLDRLLPRTLSAPATPAAAGGARVQLFTGCTGAWLDAKALHDTVQVLQKIGYAVEIPEAQGCCGALHRHGGLEARAVELARANVSAFTGDNAVLSFASGCGAMLCDYPDLIEDGTVLARRVHDVSAFVEARFPAGLQLKPLPARAAVHLACTQKNVLKAGDLMMALLGRVPGLELLPLAPASRCCGAAGLNMLDDREGSRTLLTPKLQAAALLKPDFIVSANIGCSLHLADGLGQAGLRTEVLHPMSVLARCL